MYQYFTPTPAKSSLKSGFTLAELSVVLVIIAAVVGMTVASGVTVISAARYSATASKIDALNQALMAFRIANDRLPCPSDLSRTQGSATYGTEGSCTAIAGGVFVAQNASATATAAEGGVPTVALGLPSDFMYDGWGNRFRYAADTKMTSINAFSLMQAGCVNGAITVYGGPNYPATGNTALTTGAIYALISHGANGHGGITKNAVVTNAGSLNSDEQTNGHCTSTGAAGTYAPTYVQLAPYTYQAIGQANSHYNFDDIVSYRERWQMHTNWDKVGTACAGGVYSRTITIDHTKVSTVNSTTLTNFPMLFSGTYSWLATTANGGNVTNSNGYDITFTSDAAGVNLLPFERESYNATTGAVNFWVQVPTVAATTNTTIYLWYDNPNITTDPSNKNGTWNSNYVGVWHLAETSGTTNADSTSNGLNGTKASATQPNPATGEISGAQQYNNSGTGGSTPTDYDMISSNSKLDFSGNFTVSAWVKSTESHIANYWPMIIDNEYSGSGYDLVLFNGTYDSHWYFEIWNATPTQFDVDGASSITDGNWHYIVGQRIGSTIYSYQDGAAANSSAAFSGTAGAADSLAFGTDPHHDGGAGNYKGTLDEVHISNIARSADWIVTEYNNQNSPGTFYTVGSAVSR
jgi:prepilin-type N-terminal cleavage/methylation domain-containing protein